MTPEEKKIIQTFAATLPHLNNEQKQKLLWFGEGIAFKAKQEGNVKTSK